MKISENPFRNAKIQMIKVIKERIKYEKAIDYNKIKAQMIIDYGISEKQAISVLNQLKNAEFIEIRTGIVYYNEDANFKNTLEKESKEIDEKFIESEHDL